MTVILEDPRAPHQLVIRRSADRCDHRLVVSCTCLRLLRAGRPGQAPIEARKVFPAPEAHAAWLGWHQDRGIEVPP